MVWLPVIYLKELDAITGKLNNVVFVPATADFTFKTNHVNHKRRGHGTQVTDT